MIHFQKIILPLLVLVILAGSVTTSCAQKSSGKAILVTGATSGIGLKITEYLSAAGHFVYAGARKDADMERLNKMSNVMAVRLDVTNQDQIDAAVETIRSQGRGLHGLVNNAGVAIIGPMLEVEEDDFHFQMNVNVYGPYRVTKAFAPMIIAEQGRISTIGSISGILSPARLGVYSMSKHAVEAFTDALAAELEPQGVQVSVVEPGNYKSKIAASAFKRMFEVVEKASDELTEAQKAFKERGPDDRSRYKEPDEVAEAVLDALFSSNPKRRYMVVPNQGEARYTINKAVKELVELNADHAYSYDRQALIEMLDAAMEEVAR